MAHRDAACGARAPGEKEDEFLSPSYNEISPDDKEPPTMETVEMDTRATVTAIERGGAASAFSRFSNNPWAKRDCTEL